MVWRSLDMGNVAPGVSRDPLHTDMKSLGRKMLEDPGEKAEANAAIRGPCTCCHQTCGPCSSLLSRRRCHTSLRPDLRDALTGPLLIATGSCHGWTRTVTLWGALLRSEQSKWQLQGQERKATQSGETWKPSGQISLGQWRCRRGIWGGTFQDPNLRHQRMAGTPHVVERHSFSVGTPSYWSSLLPVCCLSRPLVRTEWRLCMCLFSRGLANIHGESEGSFYVSLHVHVFFIFQNPAYFTALYQNPSNHFHWNNATSFGVMLLN